MKVLPVSVSSIPNPNITKGNKIKPKNRCLSVKQLKLLKSLKTFASIVELQIIFVIAGLYRTPFMQASISALKDHCRSASPFCFHLFFVLIHIFICACKNVRNIFVTVVNKGQAYCCRNFFPWFKQIIAVSIIYFFDEFLFKFFGMFKIIFFKRIILFAIINNIRF